MDLPKPEPYIIKSVLANKRLEVILEVYDLTTAQKKLVRLFGKFYSDDDLPEDIKKNFSDISNMHSILN